jgi:hypothetical protein
VYTASPMCQTGNLVTPLGWSTPDMTYRRFGLRIVLRYRINYPLTLRIMPNQSFPSDGQQAFVRNGCFWVAAGEDSGLTLWRTVQKTRRARKIRFQFKRVRPGQNLKHKPKRVTNGLTGLYGHKSLEPRVVTPCLAACERYCRFFLKNAVMRAHASAVASGRYPSLLLGF